jgi:nitroreductase
MNSHAWYDAGQAVANLAIEATALDLVMHQMGGFSAEKVREALRVPEGFDIVCVFALGYEGSAGDLPEHLRERELAPRTRIPLEELVFKGAFGARIHPDANTINCN